MDKSVIQKVLMVIGFIGAGIGGAAAAGSLPDDLAKVQKMMTKDLSDPVVEKTDEKTE